MPIVKLSTGKGAGGLMRYLQQGRKHAEPDRASAWQTNLPGEDREDWALFFAQRRVLNDRVLKPYLHLSVSFDPNDPDQVKLTDDQILAFGESYLERMGLHEHQWVMAVHRDREHPHVHVVVNRIGDDGRPFDLWHSAMRFREGLRDVERDHGLNPPRELNRPYQPTRGERHRPVRDGELTWKLDLASRINDAIHTSDGTWDGLVTELQRADVDLMLNPNGRGISFALTDRADQEGRPIRMKASTLGKQYRMDGLKERLAQRAKERGDLVQEARRFEPGTPRDERRSERPHDPSVHGRLHEVVAQADRDADTVGLFGGIPYRGLEGLNREEQREYTRTILATSRHTGTTPPTSAQILHARRWQSSAIFAHWCTGES
jgi:Relaxase/Mobilisation nuclease domain